jgi:hypothetical protein
VPILSENADESRWQRPERASVAPFCPVPGVFAMFAKSGFESSATFLVHDLKQIQGSGDASSRKWLGVCFAI